MAQGINPGALGRKVLKKLYGRKSDFIDEAVLPLYNIGRRLPNDCNWGEVYVSDVIGCNYRYAH